ncbi:MAG: CarD family transcriptional regulator [Eubacteriales bacterium]|nr:CarD family transcriptional regulator [Eubacteriales bacterium]
MFKINDYVVYKMNGVCQIIDIKKEKFAGDNREYYILQTVYGKPSTLYVPVDNEALVGRMKRVISSEKIYEIINAIKKDDISWNDNERARTREFNDIVSRGDCTELFSLVRTLYQNKREIEGKGKNFRVSDKKIMDDAEKILYEEFAMSLNIEPEMVISFIQTELEKNK